MVHAFDVEVPILERSKLKRNTTRFALPAVLPFPFVLDQSCRVIHASFQLIQEDGETLENGDTWTNTATTSKGASEQKRNSFAYGTENGVYLYRFQATMDKVKNARLSWENITQILGAIARAPRKSCIGG